MGPVRRGSVSTDELGGRRKHLQELLRLGFEEGVGTRLLEGGRDRAAVEQREVDGELQPRGPVLLRLHGLQEVRGPVLVEVLQEAPGVGPPVGERRHIPIDLRVGTSSSAS